ncbi:glycoside hydrolase family 99-like domain-containing protein [Dyadobacter diqingensis]|uniref:glycoside hydrolase family 99-like domain-containing protein n=1 Tax=Dyadobacter diqingensis TaxID=2938121 RepID=UPI0020C1AAAA|nr:glycoside hydrolase family 99-like domain-containing protein [Dyadobacter diqingensis]
MIKKISSVFIVISVLLQTNIYAQGNKINFGAYYFDGWTGTFPYHITKSLVDSFPEREPKWGWITSSQKIMDEQILLAADAGLSFFSFCWFYSGREKYKYEVLNNSLRYYQSSKNNDKLKYCIMISNHQGFEIGPEDWGFVSSEWIKYFKNRNYVTVDNKPIIAFFTISTLLQKFGSTSALKNAISNLKTEAQQQGLAGVSVALCVPYNISQEDIQTAESCGFDLLTGYNYHSAGFDKTTKIPVDTLKVVETKVWDRIAVNSNLRYIPTTTLNWDPRPWASSSNRYAKDPYYIGVSPTTVYNSITNCINWLNINSKNTTIEKIAFVYAWNENGEGAYLTPSKNGVNLLEGVKRALYFQRSAISREQKNLKRP